MKHLYVHIPFCRSRCAYCDFASEPIGAHARAGRVERYLEVLRTELKDLLAANAEPTWARGTGSEAWSPRAAGGAPSPGRACLMDCAAPESDRGARPGGGGAGQASILGGLAEGFPRGLLKDLETVYVGGGTPTVLPSDALVVLVRDLAMLGGIDFVRADGGGAAAPVHGVAHSGRVAAGAHTPAFELTVEANPGTIDASLLDRLAAAGATRLSLGIQSFAPRLRAALGRRVTQGEIDAALAAISSVGWREWNLDLVFGIPGQTWAEARADLDAAVAAGPTHISLYDLTYTPRYDVRVDATVGAGARRAAGAFAEQHYAAAVSRLEAAGYRRYEVSNFAIPGHECRHNQAYWRGEDYLGAGAAAVSTVGLERRTNPRSVVDYLAGVPPVVEALSLRTRLWEKAMLGLRTLEGVDETEVLPVLDEAARDRLLAQGCLERHRGKMRINPGYLDVSNAVIGTLLGGLDE